jgi:cobalamin biosynthesis Co2+ chelatase CbiK
VGYIVTANTDGKVWLHTLIENTPDKDALIDQLKHLCPEAHLAVVNLATGEHTIIEPASNVENWDETEESLRSPQV